MPYRGRFAPSPTGQLHLGSLVAAVGSWLRARHHEGVWLVRIEDLDPDREIADAADEMIETLARFGMESDEPVVWQSKRGDRYQAALATLVERGHAYRCPCSRSDLEPFGGIHPAHCVRTVDEESDAAWRVRVGNDQIEFDDIRLGRQASALHEGGDFVVHRREGWAAYQLAVVVDDAAQGVTEVVRGADLLDSTPRQILVQRYLGLKQPDYLHLPIVFAHDGRKLSKQERACPVDPNNPMPSLRAALETLGMPGITKATPRDALVAALHHPAWSNSAVGGTTVAGDAAMQRELDASFRHT
ncbi:MAG: tRNA glutamyl-Q(34) synthetase GluQRS [Dokdonella sp.]